MANKVSSLAVILVTVLALLLVSCGPRASAPTPAVPTPTAPTPGAPTPATPTPAAPTPSTTAEEPKYGGTVNVIIPTHPEIFYPLGPVNMGNEGYVLEQMLTMDYARGPAGTGEANYAGPGASPFIPSWEFVKGWLAESWEIPEAGVWVMNIRKGVHFALDPNSEASRLVGGREMTADDAKYSWEILRDTPGTLHNMNNPAMMKNMVVEKTGPWQVTVRTPVDASPGYAWLMGGGAVQYLWPREWLDKYGKVNNWRNMVGTGPYMLTDFISGSVATMKRNPNYWQKDPVAPGKGNQLPYPDGIKQFIISDTSTRLAAMRTGKADILENIQREDTDSLIKTRPSLKSYGYIPDTLSVAMRTDKEDLPYKDKRVRQALMMATDFEAIKNDLFGGQAEILTFPVNSNVPHMYRPIEKLPASVQALYKYNPTGARQLLTEAGYPNGFKAKIIVQSVVQTTASALDMAAVLKAMWAKVGVDLEIQPKESGVYTSIVNPASYDELILATLQTQSALSPRYQFKPYQSIGSGNLSYVNNPRGKDPVLEKAFQELSANFMVDPLKADQIVRDVVPYVLEQSYYIPLPAPYSYRVWQPWIKGYYGEGGLITAEAWAAHPWVDQDLKEEMTGRR